MLKFSKKIKILLIVAQILILSACVKSTFNGPNYLKGNIRLTPYNDRYYGNKLITNKEQAAVFEIADYFSNNYPYSSPQIEDYFNTGFITKYEKDSTFESVYLYPYPYP